MHLLEVAEWRAHCRASVVWQMGASADGPSIDGASIDGPSADGASVDGASIDGASIDGQYWSLKRDWTSNFKNNLSPFTL